MPDEEDKTGLEEEEVPETSLHAHGSGVEETNERPRADNIEGELLEDEEDEAHEAANTGGATSGGPPREDPGSDPSDV